jgi:hypothetical protein
MPVQMIELEEVQMNEISDDALEHITILAYSTNPSMYITCATVCSKC